MPVADSQRFTVSPDVLFERVEGEMVLMDLSSECYFGLDAVGTHVWQLLENGATPETLVENLLEVFDVGREQLQHDVLGLVQELLDAGLIKECDEHTG